MSILAEGIFTLYFRLPAVRGLRFPWGRVRFPKTGQSAICNVEWHRLNGVGSGRVVRCHVGAMEVHVTNA